MALCKNAEGEKAEDLDENAKGIIESYGKKLDYIDKDSILPLVEYVKGLEG